MGGKTERAFAYLFLSELSIIWKILKFQKHSSVCDNEIIHNYKQETKLIEIVEN